eukprot:341250_1
MALQHALSNVGFANPCKLTNTLQGSIWRASSSKSSKTDVIIKVANKNLHAESAVVIGGNKYNVHENILSETTIQRYLTKNNCPNSIVKYIDSFQTDNNYFLVQEYGGTSLMTFTMKIHEYISKGHIDINEWHKVVKIIYKQMIECIEYIHSKNVCHFDISLENFLINDINITIHKTSNGHKLKFCLDNIQVKICDFGLAQHFESNSSFMSDKFCGKKYYKSPEITNRKTFSAKKNDIFCIGVCVFMLTVGCPPFTEASTKCASFNYIINGSIVELLNGWNKINYVNKGLIVLFLNIFKYEPQRCNLLFLKKC